MRFPGLVENEILKFAKQRRFRVVVLILVALIGLIVFAQSRARERFHEKDWRVETQERMARIQNWLRDGRMPASSRRWARFELGRLQYHLERDIDPEAISGPLFARAFANASSYLLLPLLAIVFAADVVSAEFQQGTIKLLLTRPVGRARVLASKIVAQSLAITLTVVFGGIVAYLFGGIAYGWPGWRRLRSVARPRGSSLAGRDPRLRAGLVRDALRRRDRAADVGAAALDGGLDGDHARGPHRGHDPSPPGFAVGSPEVSLRHEPSAARLLLGIAPADPRPDGRLRRRGARGVGGRCVTPGVRRLRPARRPGLRRPGPVLDCPPPGRGSRSRRSSRRAFGVVFEGAEKGE
jgi:hypothetical protein